jgi:type IV secretion system protein VirD4
LTLFFLAGPRVIGIALSSESEFLFRLNAQRVRPFHRAVHLVRVSGASRMFPAKIYVGQITVVFGIVVASTWGATQWTAAALGFQERLGAPWFLIAGYPVYLPWRLFEWWFAYEAYAPEVFEKGGTIAATGGVAGALFAIINSVWRARQNLLVTTYGSARWASSKEIKAAGLFAAKGVFLGRLDNNYLRHDGPEHVMCFAPTRSGKGRRACTADAIVLDLVRGRT